MPRQASTGSSTTRAREREGLDDGRVCVRSQRTRSWDFIALGCAYYNAIVQGLLGPASIPTAHNQQRSDRNVPAEQHDELMHLFRVTKASRAIVEVVADGSCESRVARTDGARPRAVHATAAEDSEANACASNRTIRARGGGAMAESRGDSTATRDAASDDDIPWQLLNLHNCPHGDSSRHPVTAQPREQLRAQPVRGVVTIQARPSPTVNESLRSRSVLLRISSEGLLIVEELRQPYTLLLELPLQHVAAQAVPGHDNKFHIGVKTPGGEQRDVTSTISLSGIVVGLRDCSLRDQWLQVLVVAGVEVPGWQPEVDTTATRPPDGLCCDVTRYHGVRWLR